MKISLISIVAAVLLVLVGLFLWGYSGGAAGTSNPSLSGAESALVAAEKSYDFGTISMKNGNVTKDFVITNPTQADLKVASVSTSCMCTNAYIVKPDGSLKGPFGMAGHGGFVPPANEVIEAGGSRTIRVVYDPNAHGPAGVGKIDRFVTLADSAGNTLDLEIQALVTP
ncbi:DUF1573 domain-containing protein [Candidatus Kaiserbacteria bacterium]|nr:DUF1573 domain-containing protein [Candidatus Kaiserbacteria bacterium]